jgi:8-oxo-dGTP pyrophosphatase MutT (NUDIX family)
VPRPDPDAEWWNTSDVAAYLGVKIGTISAYRLRGQMPAADLIVGRTQLWKPARIIEWHSGRSRPGVGGRPAREAGHSAPILGEPDEESAWVAYGTRPLYENEWIRLGLVDVELPNGERFEHHAVWMPAAAMTALIDDAGKSVLMMWRHRFVPDIWNWELPGGIVEEGEDPADTAAREVEEETGYRPRSLEHLVTFEPMIGMVNSPHHVYLGRGAEHIGEPTETTEMQRMEWLPLKDIPELIRAGQIRNSGSLVALLHVLAISGPKPGRR